MDEIRVDALEPSGVSLLEELRVLEMERAAFASGERGIQNVAHDAAREGQAVSPRLPLLFEHLFRDELFDVVVEIARVVGESLEVSRIECLPEHGSDRKEIAVFLRKALDPLLHRLLDRR